jgi:hypothetical protein
MRQQQLALASVVTTAVLDEFKLLKLSFELHHGSDIRWFIRCDQSSEPALSQYSNVKCSVFCPSVAERPDLESPEFREIVAEKMNAIGDAWDAGKWLGVIFLDADLVMTSRITDLISDVEGQVVLTPNYYPPETEHLASIHGHYNSGFICTRSPLFHEWWRRTYISQPWRWTDQACLNDIHNEFVVGALTDRANIGFWRSPLIQDYIDIPADCQFLHVHSFQPLRTRRQWIDKSFALHCLKFLRGSNIPTHRTIYHALLSRDTSGWYEASLRLS